MKMLNQFLGVFNISLKARITLKKIGHSKSLEFAKGKKVKVECHQTQSSVTNYSMGNHLYHI